MGVAGYAAFPTTVGGNVLNSFSESDGLMQAVRGVVGKKKNLTTSFLLVSFELFSRVFLVSEIGLLRKRINVVKRFFSEFFLSRLHFPLRNFFFAHFV